MLDGPAAAGLLIAAVLASTAGMACLALAMDVHWEQAQGQGHACPRAAVQRLRVMGACGLMVSLALCLWVDHASMAMLVWVMLLPASSLAVALALTWRPRWLRVLAWWSRQKD